jgi:hypothetical protein
MPFNELERARIERLLGDFCRRCVPHGQRTLRKVYYRVRGLSVEVIDSRATASKHVRVDIPVAKLKYNEDTWEWSLYWRNLDRWQKCTELQPTSSLRLIIQTLSADSHSVFWGRLRR